MLISVTIPNESVIFAIMYTELFYLYLPERELESAGAPWAGIGRGNRGSWRTAAQGKTPLCLSTKRLSRSQSLATAALFTTGDDWNPRKWASFPAVTQGEGHALITKITLCCTCAESAKPWICVITEKKKKKGKATRISVKVRDILEFHNFQILLCEQEKAKRSFSPPIPSTPKTMTHEQLWLTFMSSVSCASAWWTAGERTPVGSSASWYLGLALKSIAASFVPPDLGVF